MKLFALIYCQDSFGSDDDSYVGIFDSMEKLNDFCSINRIKVLSRTEAEKAEEECENYFYFVKELELNKPVPFYSRDGFRGFASTKEEREEMDKAREDFERPAKEKTEWLKNQFKEIQEEFKKSKHWNKIKEFYLNNNDDVSFEKFREFDSYLHENKLGYGVHSSENTGEVWFKLYFCFGGNNGYFYLGKKDKNFEKDFEQILKKDNFKINPYNLDEVLYGKRNNSYSLSKTYPELANKFIA